MDEVWIEGLVSVDFLIDMIVMFWESQHVMITRLPKHHRSLRPSIYIPDPDLVQFMQCPPAHLSASFG